MEVTTGEVHDLFKYKVMVTGNEYNVAIHSILDQTITPRQEMIIQPEHLGGRAVRTSTRADISGDYSNITRRELKVKLAMYVRKCNYSHLFHNKILSYLYRNARLKV